MFYKWESKTLRRITIDQYLNKQKSIKKHADAFGFFCMKNIRKIEYFMSIYYSKRFPARSIRCLFYTQFVVLHFTIVVLWRMQSAWKTNHSNKITAICYMNVFSILIWVTSNQQSGYNYCICVGPASAFAIYFCFTFVMDLNSVMRIEIELIR